MIASIIIPVYNAHDTIIPCLNSLINQSLDSDTYEIICVNDGSQDNSLTLLESYVSSIPLTVINQVNSGPATARNRGSRVAKGEIILFTDSDCELHHNWLKEMLRPFKDGEVIGVQGCYRTKQTSSISLLDQFDIEYRYKKMVKAGNIDSIGTYSAAYRKEAFLAEGGFNTDYKSASGEDFELSFKLFQRGYKMVLSENAFCYHKHPDKWLKYLITKFKRGYWRVLLYKNVKNKVLNDTYTSLVMKTQFSMVLLFFISSPILFIENKYSIFPLIFLLMFLILCVPFISFTIRRNFNVALISPFIIFMRSLFFMAGMILGLFHTFTGKLQ